MTIVQNWTCVYIRQINTRLGQRERVREKTPTPNPNRQPHPNTVEKEGGGRQEKRERISTPNQGHLEWWVRARAFRLRLTMDFVQTPGFTVTSSFAQRFVGNVTSSLTNKMYQRIYDPRTLFFCITLSTGPRRPLRLEFSDAPERNKRRPSTSSRSERSQSCQVVPQSIYHLYCGSANFGETAVCLSRMIDLGFRWTFIRSSHPARFTSCQVG